MINAIKDFQFALQAKHCVVLGSSVPVFEVALVALGGAMRVTTLEYAPFHIQEGRFTVTSVQDFWRSENGTSAVQFDCAVSFSSIQHDGLGRYGDPLDPDGDLKAMQEAWSILRPGGYFFFAVPIGNDCVMFDSHRVYGRRRFPSLLNGWVVSRSYGFGEEESQWYDSSCVGHRTPVMVLQRLVVPDRQSQEEELKKVKGLMGPLPHYVQPQRH